MDKIQCIAPRHFDIVFKKHIDSGNVGQTRTTQIQLNAEWFRNNPLDLDMVLVHELSHVVQQYRSAPFYWTEGIADYVCYKLGYTNRWSGPQCTVEYPHFTSGYCCAGAFLLYLDARFGPSPIRQLNAELRRSAYSEGLFARVTGKSLSELWPEFEHTAAFTPEALEAIRVQTTLGYIEGKPPENLAARVADYLKHQTGGALTLQAAEFLRGLIIRKELPGISQNAEKGMATLGVGVPELLQAQSSSYPALRSFWCRRTGDESTFHYVVVCGSKNDEWNLRRAWRTSPAGLTLEEYDSRSPFYGSKANDSSQGH